MLSLRPFFYLLVAIAPLLSATHTPKLDLNNEKELLNVTAQAIKNLLKYYTPSNLGVFDQVETPWWESCVIWWTLLEYAKWTGDYQFTTIATDGLVNASWGTQHDFLGGNATNATDKIQGRWNDDQLWAAQAVTAGAELFGPQSVMGHSHQSWISLVTKSIDEVAVQMDNKCGGGIYWYRDRLSPRGTYKAVITQLQFITEGARAYLLTKNETLLTQAKEILDWVLTSGVSNPKAGVLLDGVSVKNCSDFTEKLWSYTYGQLLGSLAWMHKATGDQKYLDLTTPFFEYGLETFAGANTSGVITEICETGHQCNRDQRSFKSIYALNMAHLYRETNNQTQKDMIWQTFDTSLNAMVKRTCDLDWNCGGNWTREDHKTRNVAGQHDTVGLLVSALGIRANVSTRASVKRGHSVARRPYIHSTNGLSA
ncbi:hypothetical protein CROQUDRAFT_62872 [Cronartium quercuum f. sp. fusiforme G11]|uniref:Mannan endo-1,6-alpha-mannosidase n=1 Tax=Cronartium quercuum f. sp. fusiforme G11 TaxID=708437 RepID=A0A9P6NLL6_9BASI|nr:hypothetical protein CROQUDRAFT_62872 [Cronartium quercuum f. sp. fusiforme G11]